MRTWQASLAAAIIVGTAAIGTGLASGIPAASAAAAAAHVPPAGHWGGA
ncbi:hypothetical protein [Trebonia kvetii]|nr:hypothetical protein [Trebonia kvetii]